MSAMHHQDRNYVAAVDAERHAAARYRSSADAHELERLVRGAARGEEVAWSTLVRRFTRRLAGLARSHRVSPQDVEDIVQFTFVRLHDQIHTLRDPNALPAWLDTTARRESLRRLRMAGRERPLDAGIVENVPARPQPADECLGEELRAELRAAVERLPERQKTLLGMLYSDQSPSYDEISRSPPGRPTGGRTTTRRRTPPTSTPGSAPPRGGSSPCRRRRRSTRTPRAERRRRHGGVARHRGRCVLVRLTCGPPRVGNREERGGVGLIRAVLECPLAGPGPVGIGRGPPRLSGADCSAARRVPRDARPAQVEHPSVAGGARRARPIPELASLMGSPPVGSRPRCSHGRSPLTPRFPGRPARVPSGSDVRCPVRFRH